MIPTDQLRDIVQIMDKITDAEAESEHFLLHGYVDVVKPTDDKQDVVGRIILTNNGPQLETV